LFRKILAGTDGSDTARIAVVHAVDLAERLDADLTVVSVYREDPGEPIARALLRDVENAHGGGGRLFTRALQGNPATALVEAAAEAGSDLVVVGNVGITRSQWLGANVPRRVSHRSRASVLLVDTVQGRRAGYRRVLVGAGGSEGATRAVDVAQRLSERVGARLTAAVFDRSSAQAERAAEGCRARWPGVEVVAGTGAPAEGLCKLAQSGEYDLLVVGSRGSTGARRLIGSIREEVSRRARTNVLLVRAAD
jgi:nucleotide-binding universal stress UspA family protein